MPANCGWRTLFGLGSLIGATAVLITSLAGLGWRVYTVNGTTFHIGVKSYEIDFSNGDSKTGQLSDGYLSSTFNSAGDIPLGFGIPALALSLIGMVLIIIHIFRRSDPKFRHYRRIGILMNFLSGIFALIAIILYARKFWTGYSFILYIFCAFLTYVGVTFLLSHAFIGNTNDGSAGYRKKTTVTTTTTTTTTAPPTTFSQEMGVYNENLS